jgi:hypothetical protein
MVAAHVRAAIRLPEKPLRTFRNSSAEVLEDVPLFVDADWLHAGALKEKVAQRQNAIDQTETLPYFINIPSLSL